MVAVPPFPTGPGLAWVCELHCGEDLWLISWASPCTPLCFNTRGQEIVLGKQSWQPLLVFGSPVRWLSFGVLPTDGDGKPPGLRGYRGEALLPIAPLCTRRMSREPGVASCGPPCSVAPALLVPARRASACHGRPWLTDQAHQAAHYPVGRGGGDYWLTPRSASKSLPPLGWELGCLFRVAWGRFPLCLLGV